MFDYGDGHGFSIEFKGPRILDKDEKGVEFPRIIDQRGVAPDQYPQNEEA